MSGHTLLIVICILLLAYVTTKSPFYQSHTLTKSDNRDWSVIKDFSNHQSAADLLAETNHKMIEFMRVLKNKYYIDAVPSIHQDDPQDIIDPDQTLPIVDAAFTTAQAAAINAPNDIYNIVGNLLNNYNPDVFYENDPRYTKETSYTISKGEAMHLCLRNKKDPTKLVDPDILFFVMLHEASHIANYRGWGHGKDFWEVFAFILHEAETAGLYTPVDYSMAPEWYCGLLVEYNPLFDKTLKKIWLK